MNRENFVKLIEQTEGLISTQEALFLRTMAKRSTSHIVEIGSWKGKSTIALGLGSKAGNRQTVIAIDSHEGDLSYHEWELEKNSSTTGQIFLENIEKAGITELVWPLFVKSDQASGMVQDGIGFLFIDGDHRYEGVKKDFELYSPKVKVDGIIAFHDTFSWEGAIGVIDNIVFPSEKWLCLGFVGSITYFKKVLNLTLKEKIGNLIILLVRKVFVFVIFLHLPKWLLKPLKKLATKLLER